MYRINPEYRELIDQRHREDRAAVAAATNKRSAAPRQTNPTRSSVQATTSSSSPAERNYDICTRQSQSCMDACGKSDFSCPVLCAESGRRCVQDVSAGRSPAAVTTQRNATTGTQAARSPSANTSSAGQTRTNAQSAQALTAQQSSKRIDQPMSSTGKACVSMAQGQTEQESTTREHAAQCNTNGFCTDNKYVFVATNVCASAMSFRWSFPGSKYPSASVRTIQPGGSEKVSCRQVFDRCDGKISYTWFVQ